MHPLAPPRHSLIDSRPTLQHPTSFSLSLHPSPSSHLLILIHASYSGVPLPQLDPPPARTVPFTLLVEPLLAAVLPATALPLLAALVVLLAAMGAARVPQRVADAVDWVASGAGGGVKDD